ncbi:MAG: methyltransferase domain-containing protein [Patescibacteria group bacterium]|nr:methyltransferase domain-containing protein [Patescibacteria group bacterium]
MNLTHFNRSPQPVEAAPFPAADPIVRALVERHLSQPRKTILDLGCGRGNNTMYLAEQGHRVTAVDSNETYLQELAAQVEQLPPLFRGLITIKKADISEKLFLANSFDAILCTKVLHELKDKKTALFTLGCIREATKPQGINIVTGYTKTASEIVPPNGPVLFDKDELGVTYEQEDWTVLYSQEHNPPSTGKKGGGKYKRFEELVTGKPKADCGPTDLRTFANSRMGEYSARV